MKYIVKVYNKSKYEADSVKVFETVYSNVTKLEVIEKSAEEIFAEGYDEIDEYNEYLIITYENGETSTFRNSHIDLFRA